MIEGDADDSDRGDDWQEVLSLTRSHLDPRVWVPIDRDSDLTCFMHAAGIRAVKRWATRTYVDVGYRHRWVNVDGAWELHIKDR